MPVNGKRILVTLSWDTYNAIADLAKALDEPVASVARKVLEDAAPGLVALRGQIDRLRAGDVSALVDLNAMLFEVLGGALDEGAKALREAKKRGRK
jgi:hypothetical protein